MTPAQIINNIIEYFKQLTSDWTQLQWALLLAGIVVAVYAVFKALRASRIGSYKLWMMTFKIGFSLVVLAFAWPYALDLYNTAVELTGSPIYGFLSIILGVFFGYNVMKAVLRGKKNV
ncbi:MAG: hypothetical protein F7C38_06875 [Desulfurococcales archaeon]|nr:hypothetical protein [Desulfurococcales archaeon]